MLRFFIVIAGFVGSIFSLPVYANDPPSTTNVNQPQKPQKPSAFLDVVKKNQPAQAPASDNRPPASAGRLRGMNRSIELRLAEIEQLTEKLQRLDTALMAEEKKYAELTEIIKKINKLKADNIDQQIDLVIKEQQRLKMKENMETLNREYYEWQDIIERDAEKANLQAQELTREQLKREAALAENARLLAQQRKFEELKKKPTAQAPVRASKPPPPPPPSPPKKPLPRPR